MIEVNGPAEETVRCIVAHAVGTSPACVARQGGGLSSHAFDVSTSADRFIVRLGDGPDKLAGFERERQAVARATQAGIPTQTIVALGEHDGWAFTISQHLGGECATHHPERLSVLKELGRIAAVVHTIPTRGYGTIFEWSAPALNANGSRDVGWHSFLHEELNANGRIERLREQEMLTEKQQLGLAHTLAQVECWDTAPVLNHGDLRLKNVVVDTDGGVLGLIDWETAVSSVGPHWDLSIALHDLAIDAKQAFLAGYGMPEADVRRAAPVWRLFNVLNYAPTVDCLVKQGDEDALDQIRTRLSGGLELYAGAED